MVNEVFEITNKAVEDSLQKIAYNISQLEPVIRDKLPAAAAAPVPVAAIPAAVPAVPIAAVPIAAVPAIPSVPVVPASVPVDIPTAVSVQSANLWVLIGLLCLVCFLAVMLVICILRAMQGKLDIDPDVLTGKTPQTTLAFSNPFKREDPAGAEGHHNPAYSDTNIDNNLAPPPRRERRSRQKSGGRSEHSNTDESICMDFE